MVMELLYRVRPMRLDAADQWKFKILLERVPIKVTGGLYIPDLGPGVPMWPMMI